MNYQSKDLAKLAGISIRTLRYYDQIGLLSPHERTEGNYRIYHDEDVNKLQHILLFKEMGLELKQIKILMKNLNDEKRVKVLETHLSSLHRDQKRIELLIDNVKKTIQSIKGEHIMNNNEKFIGFKKEMLKKNDDAYRDEVVNRWGEEAYQSSRKAFQHMSEEAFYAFQNLAVEIIETLKKIKQKDDPSLRIKVAKDHQTWLKTAWGGRYSSDAHLGIVDMYVADERFKSYYDQHGEGLAQILRDAVYAWLNP